MANAFDNIINRMLGFLKNDPWNMLLMTIFILYSSHAAPSLPDSVLALFDSALFRFVYLFVMMFVLGENPTVAILMIVAFLVSMNILSGRRLFEAFVAQSSFGQEYKYENPRTVGDADMQPDSMQVYAGHAPIGMHESVAAYSY